MQGSVVDGSQEDGPVRDRLVSGDPEVPRRPPSTGRKASGLLPFSLKGLSREADRCGIAESGKQFAGRLSRVLPGRRTGPSRRRRSGSRGAA